MKLLTCPQTERRLPKQGDCNRDKMMGKRVREKKNVRSVKHVFSPVQRAIQSLISTSNTYLTGVPIDAISSQLVRVIQQQC